MIRLGIAGATGRMGATVFKMAKQDSRFKVISATTSPENKNAGKTFLSEMFLSVDPSILFEGTDVVIDFTAPEALEKHLIGARNKRVALVIGTTGLETHHMTQIELTAQEIPILYARNTSVGIALLHKLAALATIALGEEADIEIHERHHRDKRDAPSGTALSLGERIAVARKQPFDQVAHFGYQGVKALRQEGSIGFSVSRGGGVIGEHTISFITQDDVIDISHKALSRDIFARGALRAAAWIVNRPAGLYNMDDTLEQL